MNRFNLGPQNNNYASIVVLIWEVYQKTTIGILSFNNGYKSPPNTTFNIHIHVLALKTVYTLISRLCDCP